MSFSPVSIKTPEQLRLLASDLDGSEAMGTRWLVRLEDARAMISGPELDRFNRLYRREYDHMTSDGLKHFGPGALAGTIEAVRAIINRH